MQRLFRVFSIFVLVLAACSTPASVSQEETTRPAAAATESTDPTSSTTSSSIPATTSTTVPTTTTLVPGDGLTAADRTMVETATITGNISPKSVVAS